MFDDEQAVALALALQTATTAGAGIEEGAARALNTVRQVMPARLRHRINTLQVTGVERPTPRPNPPVDSRVLMALSAAVHSREVLRFGHDAPAAGPEEAGRPSRRVEPHHLVTWGGRWYLVAWDLDREGWRTFRADRIAPRVPTGPHFISRGLPGGDVAAFVASRFRGSDGSGDWPCRGEVVLDLSAEVVARYAGDGLVEQLGPDRCRLVMGSWSWAGPAAAIGGFDAGVEVVGPAELQDAFAHLARRCADAASSAPHL